jgi:hypothetical protein
MPVGGVRIPTVVCCRNAINTTQIHTFPSLANAGEFLTNQGVPGTRHRIAIKKYLDTEGVYGGYYWRTGTHADVHTQNNAQPNLVQDVLSFVGLSLARGCLYPNIILHFT